MNVIIKIRKGVVETPILVEDDITAEAVYRSCVEKLLGEDYFEPHELMSDDIYQRVNKALEFTGDEILFFVDIEVNKYVKWKIKI